MPPAEIVTGTLPELEDALADAIVRAREADPLAPVTVMVGHVLLKRYLPRMLAARGVAHLNVRFMRPNELAEELSPGGDAERARLSPAAERLLMREVAAAASGYFSRDRRRRRLHRRLDAALPRAGDGRVRQRDRARPGAARRRPGRQSREVQRTGEALRPLPPAARDCEARRARGAIRAGRRRAVRGAAAGVRAVGAVRVADAADRAHRGGAAGDGCSSHDRGWTRTRRTRRSARGCSPRGRRSARSAAMRPTRRRSIVSRARCFATARRPSMRRTCRW